jgi:hypothetical protein
LPAELSGSERRTPAGKRRRRWRWLLLLVLLLAGAVFGLRFLLQPERMGALLLEQAARASGLQLSVSAPAELGLFPRLRLQLQGLEVRASPGLAPLLRAERVDVALPLAVLWGAEVQSGDIAVLAPMVDVVALQAWLDQEDETGPPAALRLPQFAARVQVSDGRVTAADWQLEDLDLRLSALRDGEPLEAEARFSLLEGEQRRPLTLRLAATPRQQSAGIAIQELLLHLGQPNAAGSGLELSGDIDVFTPQRLRLDLWVNLAQPWLLPLPTLPEQLGRLLEGPMSLRYDGPGDLSARMALERIGADAELRLAAAPRELLAWIDDAAASPLPPAAFSAKVPTLEFNGVRIEGLEVELVPEDASQSGPTPGPEPVPASTP